MIEILKLFQVLFFFQVSMFIIFNIFVLHWSRKSSGVIKNKNARFKVAVVIPCHNEEAVIRKKLANVFDSIFSKNGSVYVVDDGSRDGTFQIANEFKNSNNLENLFVWKHPGNRGKARALNWLFKKIKEDIIVVTDADSLWRKNSLIELTSNFGDPIVGAVTGKMVVAKKSGKFTIREEGLYRKLFDLWSRAESNLDSCSVFNGQLMAVKKVLIEKFEINENTYADDTDLLFKVRRSGYRAIYEPNAVVYEFICPSILGRMKQQIRRAGGLTQILLNNLDIIGRYGYFGKVIYPFSVYNHIISPIFTVVLLFLFPFILINYPIFSLGGLLLLIPAVRVAIVGYIFRNLALVIGLMIPKKGEWKPVHK